MALGKQPGLTQTALWGGVSLLCAILVAGCSPVPRNSGTLDLRVNFSDGHVETQRLSADSARLEGCREVQRLRLLANPGDGDRLWVELLLSGDQAEMVRLAYAGSLTGGAYASWDQLGDLSAQYRDPYLSTDIVARPQLQAVSVDLAVESPWTVAPEITRVEVTLDGTFRAEWWLTEFKLATIYCDQAVGVPDGPETGS